jgi:hypothetical protein
MSELPQSLLLFIRKCIPTYQAAEVILFLSAHPDRHFGPEDIVVAMRPVVITMPAVKEYLALFTSCGLIAEANGRITYGPASVDLENRIGELARAYNERPVSLIRNIYQISDSKIQSFADSFTLRED